MTAVEWLVSIHRTREIDVFDIQKANKIFEEQIKNAMMYALDEDGHTGDWKIKFVNTYYNDKFDNFEK